MEIVLRNKESHYLGFKKGHDPELWVSTTVGSYEKFNLVENADKTFSIENRDGHYLTIHEKNLKVDTRIGSNEKFSLKEIEDNFLNIVNKDGYALGFKRKYDPPFWGATRKSKFEKISFVDMSGWMTRVFPKIKHQKLGDLMMIGGHNSAMNRKQITGLYTWTVNQYYGIDEQFAAGCRYFELRLYHPPGSSYYVGYHGNAPALGSSAVTSNAKHQLKQLARKIGDKELIILDLARSNNLKRTTFIKDMEDFFGDRVIYPDKAREKYDTDELANLTVEQLTSLGNVIIMTKEFKGLKMWPRETSLRDAWKDKNKPDKLIPALEDDVEQRPERFDNKIWIHDAYLTSAARKLSIKDLATEAAEAVRSNFMKWRKLGFRINTVKLDFVNDRGNSALMDDILNHYASNRSDEYKPEGTAFFIQRENIPGTLPLYGIFRTSGLNDHLYTVSETEKRNLLENKTNALQGTIGYIHKSEVEGSIPLFRLYNPTWNDHLYTVSDSEKEGLISHKWVYEGTVGFVFKDKKPGTKPVKRFYKELKRDHYYTGEENQVSSLDKIWQGYEKEIRLSPCE